MTQGGDGTGGRVDHGIYRAVIGSQAIDLPVMPVADGTAVAVLVTSDVPLSFLARVGDELADRLAAVDPDVVVTAASGGVPVGMAVARALGHDQLVVLHNTPRSHHSDILTEPLRPGPVGDDVRELRLDLARQWLIEDRRVVFVDDVISTGGSALASIRLISRAGGRVVALGAMVGEGTGWRDALDGQADAVHTLGTLPRFRPATGGGWLATDLCPPAVDVEVEVEVEVP